MKICVLTSDREFEEKLHFVTEILGEQFNESMIDRRSDGTYVDVEIRVGGVEVDSNAFIEYMYKEFDRMVTEGVKEKFKDTLAESAQEFQRYLKAAQRTIMEKSGIEIDEDDYRFSVW